MLNKVEKQKPTLSCTCKCTCNAGKVKALVTKPKPGGAAITETEYLTVLEDYNNIKGKSNYSLPVATPDTSPKPSTSGLNMNHDPHLNSYDDDDSDDDANDTECCCVCNKFIPLISTKNHL